MPLTSYSLVDSGGLAKLERFGEKLLVRPSRFCLWSRRRPELWDAADAEFDHKTGWSTRGARFEEWTIEDQGIRMTLRLQQNGQVGLFPEHASYATRLAELLPTAQGRAPLVLNLFAYTGLATVFCARAGAEVVHVDLSKQVNGWARQNLSLSGLAEAPVRFIQEDTLAFLDREHARGRLYDLVVADPPSFSRVSSKSTWNLDDVFAPLLERIERVMRPGASLVLTSHRFELGPEVMANLAYDVFTRPITVERSSLVLEEEDSPRLLPAGYLVTVRG